MGLLRPPRARLGFVAVSTRAVQLAQLDPLSRLRYRVSLVAMVFTVTAFGVAWRLNRPGGMEGLWNYYGLSSMAVLLSALGVTLYMRPKSIGRIGVAIVFLGGSYLVAKTALTLFVLSAEHDPRIILAPFAPWGAIIVVSTFVLLDRRPAVVMTTAYSAACCLVGVAYLIIQPGQRTPGMVNVVLQQFVLSNFGYVAISYVLTTINRGYAEASATAQQLGVLAYSDELTGLPNRRWFRETLQGALDTAGGEARPLSTLILDLDHFKSVNDTYGHEAGDDVLHHAAQTLRRSLRGGDHMARWGGEEFVVLALETDPEHAMALGNRLAEAMRRETFPHAGKVTASVGVSTLRAGDSADSLLRRADEALYLAKDAGRNCVVFGGSQVTGPLSTADRA